LFDALQQLRRRWDEIEPHWNDPVRLEFEEKIGEPLYLMSEETLRAIDRLSQVFTQARNECTGNAGMGGLS
jgi:hypothetical protein